MATYNIHRCVGIDGQSNPARIIEVLKQLDADIIALQEVETALKEKPDLIEHIGQQTGMQAFAGFTIYNDYSQYGNALLSRIKVERLRRENISVKGREPRGALWIQTTRADKSIQIVATHLGLLPGERRAQVKRVLGILEEQTTDVAVLMGDLNEWFLWGRPLRWLHKHFKQSGAPATFPARFPLFALDRIWVEPRARLVSIRPHTSTLAKVASDHLPLKAELTL